MRLRGSRPSGATVEEPISGRLVDRDELLAQERTRGSGNALLYVGAGMLGKAIDGTPVPMWAACLVFAIGIMQSLWPWPWRRSR